MKTILKFSVLALAATALFSCQKPSELNEPVSGERITRTFKCTFAQPDTKLAVSEAGKTAWEVGDEIMVHGGKDGADRQLVTLTAADISADGKVATITIVDLEPYSRTDVGVVSEYYAQYPASLVPEGNMYYECWFTDVNDFLMAACDKDDTFVFYNLCGLITYKVTGDFDKMVFSGNDGEPISFEGDYQARIRYDESGMVTNYNKPGNTSANPVQVSEKAYTPVTDGSTLNYIFIPAGATFSQGFTLKFYKGDELKQLAKSTKKVAIKPGQLLALGNIDAHLEEYVEVVDPVSDHKSAITGATDLSNAQANCYMITAPGAYKFPSLKGNSTEATDNIHGVELVWETYNNNEEVTANSVIAAVDFEDNWIYFRTPSTLKPGNALIAAKNHDGKIVWSWHIWVPETTVQTIDATAVSGLNMMDRNLGALVVTDKTDGATVESFGLYYQYGRKDPFLPPHDVKSSSRASVAEGQEANLLNKGQLTLNEAIAQPNVFGAVSGGDWQSGTTSKWSATEKTAYDPCPSGYRIAYGEKSSSATYPLWNSSSIPNAAPGWELDADGYWFKVGTGNGELVFPLAGYYDDNQEGETLGCTHAYDRAAIWFMATNSSSKYHLNIRVGGDQKAGSTSAARGCTIRCVTE